MKPLLVILAFFLLVQNWSTLSAHFGAKPDYDAAVNGPVTLYATQWCGYCRKTRTLLKALDIPYTEIDVEASVSGSQAFNQLGGLGVPLVTVGATVIRGYDPQALKAALDSPATALAP